MALVISVLGRGGVPQPPPATTAAGAGPGDLFGYDPGRASDFVARATAGNAHVLFAKSPGGALITAARVAAYRSMIDRATAGTGIDPALLEGLVFVESAGRPQVIAGSDAANAAGLTQILAQTGQSLLGMHIDLSRSRALTAQIDAVASGAHRGRLAALLARRAAVDDRFNPAKELAATVRYLEIAQRRFGRQDLALESYHMGIGNLQHVLGDYDSGRSVPYGQVYFDSTPHRHPAAFNLLASFGDDSELYYWRILGAVQIMHLYRTDHAALARLAALQDSDDAGAAVLHPADVAHPYADPAALAAAYQRRTVVPLPSNAAQLGIAVSGQIGARAGRVGAPASLYRGLRPVALRVLIEIAAQVWALSGVRAPLRLVSTVADQRYQRRVLGGAYAPAATGYAFAIERRYADPAQAAAFQAVLDRLQSLNLIAWAREPTVIWITAAADAVAWRP
ncbi:MAG TPA: transglycosylase SLT domain-containing protein [Solirubrobacteraceae bacterium]|nr:transglycosylase SLT domain-containing protein [Solirubrobacteraceae bacterium]